jgi:hypothetical protein
MRKKVKTVLIKDEKKILTDSNDNLNSINIFPKTFKYVVHVKMR